MTLFAIAAIAAVNLITFITLLFVYRNRLSASIVIAATCFVLFLAVQFTMFAKNH